MNCNLTPNQQEIVRWIVEQVRVGNLEEDFIVLWSWDGGPTIASGASKIDNTPEFTNGVLEALAAEGFLVIDRSDNVWHYILCNKAYEAVDNNFAAPDTSFVRHLTPLADITTFDDALKTRCLPILGAGSADPALWDSAVRTAMVVLEERIRDVGEIPDASRVGRDLVNAVFGAQGTLAHKFADDSERQGYRDLLAGIVGSFRNPYGHRLIDPTPDSAGAILVFTNLLLKRLEDLH